MACAYPRPQFQVDKFIVLKSSETSNVLEIIKYFQRQFRIRGWYRQTIMDKCGKVGCLNKNVGNTGCPRTARTEAIIDMVMALPLPYALTSRRNFTSPV